MSNKKSGLLIVAHPDDESIYFSGLLLSNPKVNWTVVCVTNGNADGHGSERYLQFKQACKLLKVKKIMQWDFEDKFENRLPISEISKRLVRDFDTSPSIVYTHSIIGEYGHPHHQDVSMAVHMAFNRVAPVWSVAYNTYPEKVIKLSDKQFHLKLKILTQIYQSETRRFLNFLPGSAMELFCKLSYKEVQHIYSYLIGSESLNKNKLKVYKDFYPYLVENPVILRIRPF